MKKKITQIVVGMFLGLTGLQAQVSCVDRNGFVDYKNKAGTGAFTLNAGYVEKAAQTYNYSGPGKVTSVRVYGNYPGVTGGVALKVGIYNVDASGRPTSVITSTNATWWWYNNISGYIDVNFFGGGVALSHNFAVEVELRPDFPWGNSFMLQYTGDGEGGGQDLASLAGTYTGNNWVSAKNNFSKDGDFYLVPKMTNFITADFSASTQCLGTGDPVTFSNSTLMTVDSMFNRIGLHGYSGGNHYYTWNFGDGSPLSNATSPSHSYSTAGVYTVSLTSTIDGWNGTCSDTKTMKVSVGLAAGTTSIVNVSCNGSNNGSVTAVATGGASPYLYSLNGEAAYGSNATFNNLTAGNYTMYIKDNVGCVSTTSFAITQPTAIVFTSVSTTNASCGNTDGGILVNAAGGTGTLQYKLNSGSYQNSGSFMSLAAGSYTVTVKDANGCTTSQPIGVNDVGGPVLSLVSMTNVSCHGGSDGSIILNASGGSGTLQYTINGGITYQFSGNFPNVPAGVYLAMVKDANGCSQAMQITIKQPPALGITASSSPTYCNGSNDGQINVLSATGGTGAFTYSINGVTYQSGTNFEGLTAGTYTVYVKDVAGCTATTSVTVGQPAALTASVSQTSASCNGSADGSITVSGSGGTTPYEYSIDGGMDPQEPGMFTDLAAGTYTVSVTDANSCSYTTSVTITQPTPITASISTTTSTCGNSNGGILVSASGGSGSGYQYSFDDVSFNGSGSFTGLSAGTYYILVEDGSGCSNVFPATVVDANGPSITSSSFTNVACNGGNDGTITINTVTGGTGTLQYSINGTNWQLSDMFTGLFAGSYTVTVKDANGCTGTSSFVLTQPAAFVINTSVTNLTCHADNSGSVSVAASGGSGTLAYSIDGGLTYQSSPVFNNLNSGVYTVIVRDFAGCSGTASFVITEPLAVVVGAAVLNVTCHEAANGSIILSASGGTGTYTYSIDGVNYQSSNIFTGLSGGSYTGYVKDVEGCIGTKTVIVKEPAPLFVSPTVSDVSCFGGDNGVIVLNVGGGTSPYMYQWSNQSENPSVNNLTAGTYFVTVTDYNGCSYSASYVVTQPAAPIVINGVITNASSPSSTDGSISLSTTGGATPYNFSWSNGATTENLTNVAPGSYTITVTDANGCISTMTFTVGVVTGIASIDRSGAGLSLYPNPSNNTATLDANGQTITSFKIMDVLGQVVSQAQPGKSKVIINSGALNQGVYFIQAIINGKVVTTRMSVIR